MGDWGQCPVLPKSVGGATEDLGTISPWTKSLRLVDLRPLLEGNPAGYGKRTSTDGIVLHHTVTGTRNPVDIWKSIARQHITDWHFIIGIGYHVGVNRDGTVVQLADLDSWRAHIALLNDRYIGLAVLGDYSTEPPPASQLEGIKRAVAWIREAYPGRPLLGHGAIAVPEEPTECPGSALLALLPSLG